MERLVKGGLWTFCRTGVFYSTVFLLWSLMLYSPMLCVYVCISQWLKLHCSDEPVSAGGPQSTLCHVRAAGSGANEVSRQLTALSCRLRVAMAQRGSCREYCLFFVSAFLLCPGLVLQKKATQEKHYGIRWMRHCACSPFPSSPFASSLDQKKRKAYILALDCFQCVSRVAVRFEQFFFSKALPNI